MSLVSEICSAIVSSTVLGIFTIIILTAVQYFFPTRRQLNGECVLITGAGMGIGREMALKFANEGCNIVLWDINGQLIQNVAKEIQAKYPDCMVSHFVCDVSKQDSVHQAALDTLSKVNRVDILVNNAGIVSGGHFLDLEPSQIERTMNVNFMASCWTCREFLPGMIARESGHIVTISSLMGLIGGAGLTDYCASKFAVLGFAHSLRMELYKLGGGKIGTSIICPYAISTGMFQGIGVNFQWLFPILKPVDVADRVVTAVACKEIMVVIPWTIEWIESITRLLPMQCRDYINIICGGLHGMDTFVGRRNEGTKSEVQKVNNSEAVLVPVTPSGKAVEAVRSSKGHASPGRKAVTTLHSDNSNTSQSTRNSSRSRTPNKRYD